MVSPRAAVVPLTWEGTVERGARKRDRASLGGRQVRGTLGLAPAQLEGEAAQVPAWEQSRGSRKANPELMANRPWPTTLLSLL